MKTSENWDTKKFSVPLEVLRHWNNKRKGEFSEKIWNIKMKAYIRKYNTSFKEIIRRKRNCLLRHTISKIKNNIRKVKFEEKEKDFAGSQALHLRRDLVAHDQHDAQRLVSHRRDASRKAADGEREDLRQRESVARVPHQDVQAFGRPVALQHKRHARRTHHL